MLDLWQIMKLLLEVFYVSLEMFRLRALVRPASANKKATEDFFVAKYVAEDFPSKFLLPKLPHFDSILP